MPYIEPTRRPRFKRSARALGQKAECAGDLNYIITEMVHEYIKKTGKKYDTLNSVVGALECSKIELYRMLIAPYEDTKIAQNGDVGLNDSTIDKDEHNETLSQGRHDISQQ